MRNTLSTLLLASAALGLFALPAHANRPGVVGKSRTGCGGLGCHEGGDDPSVTLEGPGMMAAGQQAELTLTVAGGQDSAGCNLSASAGMLDVADDALRRLGPELTHKGGPLTYTDGRAVFRFLFTAPAEPGPVTIYAAGNSVNDNALQTGDGWAVTELVIEVGEGGPGGAGGGGPGGGGAGPGGGGAGLEGGGGGPGAGPGGGPGSGSGGGGPGGGGSAGGAGGGDDSGGSSGGCQAAGSSAAPALPILGMLLIALLGWTRRRAP